MRQSALLAVALFCISASISAQSSMPTLTLGTGPLVSGGAITFEVHSPRSYNGDDVVLYLGDAGGSSTLSARGQTFIVPLIGAVQPVGRGVVNNGLCRGHGILPTDPALIGTTPSFSAVVLSRFAGPRVSWAMPFGPIIEDSLQ